MNFGRWTNPPPIGLDVGAAVIKAAQISGTEARTLVLPRQEPGQPLEVTEIERLARILDRRGFSGKRLVLTTPDSHVITETLALPPADSGAPRAQLARAELARIRQLDPNAFELGFWDLPAPARGGEAGHVTACACQHANSEPWLDGFEAQGFDVMALDVKPCALARACDRINQPRHGIVGLIDIGYQAVRLVLIHRSTVIFARSNLEAGLGRLHACLTSQFHLREDQANQLIRRHGLTHAHAGAANHPTGRWASVLSQITNHVDAAAADLSRSLTYARQRYPDTPISSIGLVGGGGAVPGMAEHLTQALGIETQSMDRAMLGLKPVDVSVHRPRSGTLAENQPVAQNQGPSHATHAEPEDDQGSILATAMGLAKWSPTTNHPRTIDT